MKNFKIFITILVLFSVSVKGEENLKDTLKVRVINFENSSGKAVVNLFRKGDDMMGKPFLQLKSEIINYEAEVSFTDLPYGNYAVFAFHDENDNGTLDHNWLNIPAEPMGYSNDWNFGLFSGMPAYEKTGFTFSNETSSITIKLD